MSKVIMMIGLPASGKSTRAKELMIEHEAVLISSDTVRDEMFGKEYDPDNNAMVFEEVNSRIIENLRNGVNVIYDATNINRKRRIHFINHVARGYNVFAHYMNTTFLECVMRDANRSSGVSYDVIVKMYKSLHVPARFEGFADITIDGDLDEENNRYDFELLLYNNEGYDVMETLGDMFPYVASTLDEPHDSSYHSFSISRHIYYTYDYIQKYYENADHKLAMMCASIFHDIGKTLCKEFVNFKGDPIRYASYIGHENVSAQMAVSYLRGMGYRKSFVLEVSELIQLHMMPHNSKSEKATFKLKKLIGAEKYEKLMYLHLADNLAK